LGGHRRADAVDLQQGRGMRDDDGCDFGIDGFDFRAQKVMPAMA
jgi:hypothetical protein